MSYSYKSAVNAMAGPNIEKTESPTTLKGTTLLSPNFDKPDKSEFLFEGDLTHKGQESDAGNSCDIGLKGTNARAKYLPAQSPFLFSSLKAPDGSLTPSLTGSAKLNFEKRDAKNVWKPSAAFGIVAGQKREAVGVRLELEKSFEEEGGDIFKSKTFKLFGFGGYAESDLLGGVLRKDGKALSVGGSLELETDKKFKIEGDLGIDGAGEKSDDPNYIGGSLTLSKTFGVGSLEFTPAFKASYGAGAGSESILNPSIKLAPPPEKEGDDSDWSLSFSWEKKETVDVEITSKGDFFSLDGGSDGFSQQETTWFLGGIQSLWSIEAGFKVSEAMTLSGGYYYLTLYDYQGTDLGKVERPLAETGFPFLQLKVKN